MSKDKSKKIDKKERRQRKREQDALQPQAPPRSVPPLRNPPVSSMPGEPSSSMPSTQPQSTNAQDRGHEGFRETASGQELDVDITDRVSRKHPRSSDAEDQKRIRTKRSKKLQHILEKMDHDVTANKVSEEIANFRIAARLVARIGHLFVASHNALVFGEAHARSDAGSDASDDESSDDDEPEDLNEQAQDNKEARARARAQKREYMFQYYTILNIMPDLKTDLDILDAEQLVTYAKFVDHFAHAARGDDTNALRKDIMVIMQLQGVRPTEAYSAAPASLVKHLRGWHNRYTARLMCPQELLGQFDDDPERFCQRVLDGDIKIAPGQYPSSLYDQELAQDGDGNEHLGLLRSLLLVAAYKRVWTGRASSLLLGPYPGNTVGKQPISRLYNINRVHARSIAYVAVLMRFSVSSQGTFKAVDEVGGFNNLEYYTRLVNLFQDSDSPWCKETLTWWDSQVYGTVATGSKKGKEPQKETAADRLERRLKAERKARREAVALAHT